MDQARLALALLLVKGRVLLHKLQAQIHAIIAYHFLYKNKIPTMWRSYFDKQRIYNLYKPHPLISLYRLLKSCQSETVETVSGTVYYNLDRLLHCVRNAWETVSGTVYYVNFEERDCHSRPLATPQ